MAAHTSVGGHFYSPSPNRETGDERMDQYPASRMWQGVNFLDGPAGYDNNAASSAAAEGKPLAGLIFRLTLAIEGATHGPEKVAARLSR
jgi:hypothetical protein